MSMTRNADGSVNAAITELDLEILGHLLCLPKGHRVAEAWPPDPGQYPRRLKIVVEGPELPKVLDGGRIPRANIRLRCTDPGKLSFDGWGLEK